MEGFLPNFKPYDTNDEFLGPFEGGALKKGASVKSAKDTICW